MARRYQRVNQKPQIKEIQTIQWPEEKRQKDDLQNITKQKTKDREIRTPLTHVLRKRLD